MTMQAKRLPLRSLLLTSVTCVCAQAMQIARNSTTNEMANWTRYKYLHAQDGGFANPFDRGWRRNCGEALCGETLPPVQLLPASIETTSLLRMEEGSWSADKHGD